MYLTAFLFLAANFALARLSSSSLITRFRGTMSSNGLCKTSVVRILLIIKPIIIILVGLVKFLITFHNGYDTDKKIDSSHLGGSTGRSLASSSISLNFSKL